jgi:RNA polymerase sigma-70 factor (ECF subfamily)
MTYSEPARAMMRKYGIARDDDLEEHMQEYFARFIEKGWLDQLDQEKGRFRSFLKASIRNFLHKRYRETRYHRKERSISGDDNDEAAGLPEMPAGILTPEQEFDRAWARTLMQNAIMRFRQKCTQTNTMHYVHVFERHVLHAEAYGMPSYAESAAELNVSEKDVTNYLHRARKRFGRILCELVRETVAGEGEIEGELCDLERYLSL